MILKPPLKPSSLKLSKKAKITTPEKAKAESQEKKTLPGPPYFTGKRKHT